uniref:Uncharacterized protein n=1 Tax=Caenorhabditis japonica TaxID=281687 RepID=A0A8R1EB47_CAEJA
MKLIPLLLLVVIACWTQATIFEASGVVQCDLPGQTWCSDIRIYEIDVFNDDVVAVTGKQCTSNKSRKYQLEGEEDGDGLWDVSDNVFLMKKQAIRAKHRPRLSQFTALSRRAFAALRTENI